MRVNEPGHVLHLPCRKPSNWRGSGHTCLFFLVRAFSCGLRRQPGQRLFPLARETDRAVHYGCNAPRLAIPPRPAAYPEPGRSKDTSASEAPFFGRAPPTCAGYPLLWKPDVYPGPLPGYSRTHYMIGMYPSGASGLRKRARPRSISSSLPERTGAVPLRRRCVCTVNPATPKVRYTPVWAGIFRRRPWRKEAASWRYSTTAGRPRPRW